MRFLGIDLGGRRIGLALSDRTNTIAGSLGYVSPRKALEEILRLVEQEAITHIVIGLPLHMNGDKGEGAIKAEEFGESLGALLPETAILFEDERLTTVTAQRVLIEGDLSRKRRKEKVDALAAALILQKHLDRRK